MSRIGVVITALCAMICAIALTAPVEVGVGWFAIALLGMTGIGLLLGAWFARVLGGLLFLGGLVLAPLSLIEQLSGSPSPGGWDLGRVLSVANAIATTLLLAWLCVRALQVLRGASGRASVVTARLAGGVLALVAVNHLWLAAQVGVGWQGSWSINISPRGTTLLGFPGWALWHLAVLVPSLVLLAGPRRMLGGAATVLMLLCAGMVPLVILAAGLTGSFELELVLLVVGTVLVPVYLAWWLRDELRMMVPGKF